MRKSGFRLFSIRRRIDVEADSIHGELEMLVMKYVRRICEKGKTDSAGIFDFSPVLLDVDAGVEEGIDDGAKDAGFSIAAEECILRPPALLLPPS